MAYYVNCNLSPNQRDQWSLSFSSLPAPGYDSCLGWSILGLGLASSEPVPAPQNAQLEFADIPSTETYNLDMMRDYWCPYTNSDVKPYHLPPACTHRANQSEAPRYYWLSYTDVDRKPHRSYVPRASAYGSGRVWKADCSPTYRHPFSMAEDSKDEFPTG
jgi:hypothetical protein